MFVKYEQLDVYKRAFEAAVALHKSSLDFPQVEQFHGIADQLRRSTKSICANLAEGLSKVTSNNEEKRFIGMALGSCEESRVWLHFAFKLGYLSETMCRKWRNEYEEIARMLYTLSQKRERKKPS